jgi:Flp pilus assembly protein TadD
VDPSQGRFWLTFAGISLACCVGCNQPPQNTNLGNLPVPTARETPPSINATTYFAHGHLLERQGQFERAAMQYRKALAARPDFPSVRNRLGITLNKLGQHAEATAEFRHAIAVCPELAHLRNNLGFSLYLEGLYAEAEAALLEALELRPDFARAHMNYALVLAKLDRFDEVFPELLLAGSEADACFNMGMLLTEAVKYVEAARYFEAALAVKPDFDAARQQLREVSRLAAEWEEQQAAQATLVAQTLDEEPTPEAVEAATADSAAEDASLEEPPEADPAEALTEDPQPIPVETEETEETDTAPPASEDVPQAAAPLPATDAEPEPPVYAQEPGIDPQLLFAMISEALEALKTRADDLETLWCRVGYYLFPETAPDHTQANWLY